METLSFVLGMASVVVIAIAVVAVYAFVKVRKIEKELENVGSDVYRQIERNHSEFHRRIDELGNAVYSQLDSRLDKLEQKLITKK